MRTSDKLQVFLVQGVKREVVSASLKEDALLNDEMGVNHDNCDPTKHRIVTASSC